MRRYSNTPGAASGSENSSTVLRENSVDPEILGDFALSYNPLAMRLLVALLIWLQARRVPRPFRSRWGRVARTSFFRHFNKSPENVLCAVGGESGLSPPNLATRPQFESPRVSTEGIKDAYLLRATIVERGELWRTRQSFVEGVRTN